MAAGVEVGRLRAQLDDLASTLEGDRTLRLSSPPPSDDQLSYSTALIRRQVEQLQGILRPPPAPGRAPAGLTAESRDPPCDERGILADAVQE